MDRRSFAKAVVLAGAAALAPRLVRADAGFAARNIVLVHGLFADGSCWSEVIGRLQAAGLNATAGQLRAAGAEPSKSASKLARVLAAG